MQAVLHAASCQPHLRKVGLCTGHIMQAASHSRVLKAQVQTVDSKSSKCKKCALHKGHK